MVERGSNGFEDFYQAERATLLRAVAFALGDLDLGAEATDEAMARAYERWGEVGSMANPSGWVYRVAVNLGYNRTRRRALERRRPVAVDRDRADCDGPRRLLGEVLSASCGA
jgi:DNA-directed RNA polymerase specialized sigma24 family protein